MFLCGLYFDVTFIWQCNNLEPNCWENRNRLLTVEVSRGDPTHPTRLTGLWSQCLLEVCRLARSDSLQTRLEMDPAVRRCQWKNVSLGLKTEKKKCSFLKTGTRIWREREGQKDQPCLIALLTGIYWDAGLIRDHWVHCAFAGQKFEKHLWCWSNSPPATALSVNNNLRGCQVCSDQRNKWERQSSECMTDQCFCIAG